MAFSKPVLDFGLHVNDQRVFKADKRGQGEFFPESPKKTGSAATKLINDRSIFKFQVIKDFFQYPFFCRIERRETSEYDIIGLVDKKQKKRP
jgi:hypothetical protein